MYMGLGIFLLVLGGILRFGVTADVSGVSFWMIGIVCMLGGVLSLVISFVQLWNRVRDAGVNPVPGQDYRVS